MKKNPRNLKAEHKLYGTDLISYNKLWMQRVAAVSAKYDIPEKQVLKFSPTVERQIFNMFVN